MFRLIKEQCGGLNLMDSILKKAGQIYLNSCSEYL